MNIWKMMLHHDDPEGAFAHTVTSGHVAVGWGEIGDLRALQPTEAKDITHHIRRAYPEGVNSHMGGPSLWNFYSMMREGDLVILAGGDRRHLVVEIVGPCTWASPYDSLGDYQHRRRAVETRDDPDALWSSIGGAVSPGQSTRWTVALCAEGLTESEDEPRYSEGSRYDVLSQGVERRSGARSQCIAHHGLTCAACTFDFEEQYGDIGCGFIHVHHREPLHNAEGSRPVDPVLDLVPLCPNCHAMVHRVRPPLTVAELQQRLRRR